MIDAPEHDHAAAPDADDRGPIGNPAQEAREVPAVGAHRERRTSPGGTNDAASSRVERVVFLPGAGGAAEFWHAVGRRLPAHWDRLYLGWPGLGTEPADPAVKGFDDLVHLVEEHLTTPAHVVAQSMGAIVAIRVALRRPDMVRRLVLVATSGGLDMAGVGASEWRRDYRRDYPHAASWITETYADHTRDLPTITTPTVLVSGDADPISPLAVGERLLGLLPNATLEIVAGGGHDLAVTHAPQVARVITRADLREGW